MKTFGSYIVGVEELKKYSVTGHKCNRFPNSVPKPPLPSDKLNSVISKYKSLDKFLRELSNTYLHGNGAKLHTPIIEGFELKLSKVSKLSK